MSNVYTEEYLREWKIIEEQYGEKNGGRPAALRRARASPLSSRNGTLLTCRALSHGQSMPRERKRRKGGA